jgi:hypothetical protein
VRAEAQAWSQPDRIWTGNRCGCRAPAAAPGCGQCLSSAAQEAHYALKDLNVAHPLASASLPHLLCSLCTYLPPVCLRAFLCSCLLLLFTRMPFFPVSCVQGYLTDTVQGGKMMRLAPGTRHGWGRRQQGPSQGWRQLRSCWYRSVRCSNRSSLAPCPWPARARLERHGRLVVFEHACGRCAQQLQRTGAWLQAGQRSTLRSS